MEKVYNYKKLNKQQVSLLKQGDVRLIYELLSNSNNKNIAGVLKYLGYLPADFDGTYLLPLLYNKDHRIRYLAVKNLGKLKDNRFLSPMIKIAKIESNSEVRREIVSAIGRMQSSDAIDFLSGMTLDEDPKVVLQAIRGLLCFREDKRVQNVLNQLSSHPNEMIQEIIGRESKNCFSSKTVRSESHLEAPDFMKNAVLACDVQLALKYFPDESIHLTFTSPPYYNARDYTFYKSYREYLDFLTNVFDLIIKKTKEGRFFVLNTSPIIIPRVSRQHASKRYPIPFDIHHRLVEIGWEFIDDIVWVKPEYSAKNRVAGFDQHRKPLAYKPNPITEYLMVYRKKTEKLIDWNIRQYPSKIVNNSKILGEFDTSNVWYIDPVFDKIHSAVFPLLLCKKVIQYYSFKGDLVFDPFAGSGTLGKAALMLERNFILTETSAKYIKRIEETLRGYELLTNPKIRFPNIATFIREANNEIRG